MTQPNTRLPVNLPARGLDRLQAAEYIGVSPSHLDKLIKDGMMPQGILLGGRRVWDRKALDECFERLSDQPSADDPWSNVRE